MGEDEIRSYLSRQSSAVTPSAKPKTRAKMRPPRAAPPPPEAAGFKDFSATHLFCGRCRQANPVRERILLFLSDGDLYDYSCTVCGTSCGTRKAGN